MKRNSHVNSLAHLDRVRNRLRHILPNWAVTMLKAAWAEYSFRTFKPRIVRHHYGTHDFQIQLIDFDGALWLDRDYKEREFAEIGILSQHKLIPGAKVFNAGANQCIQAMMMAKVVKPTGFVWAIEPNPHNVQAGKRNCELNGIDNVKLIQAAASSTCGQLWFNNAMNGHVALSSHEAGAHLVDAVTVDELAAKLGRPDVLYIDVEGFECEVLKGARATLASHVPDCFVEVHLKMGLERHGGSLAKVLSFFPSGIYDLFYSDGGDGVFCQINANTALPQGRFYLIALSRLDTLKLEPDLRVASRMPLD